MKLKMKSVPILFVQCNPTALLAESKPVNADTTAIGIPKSSNVNIIYRANNNLSCSLNILAYNAITLHCIWYWESYFFPARYKCGITPLLYSGNEKIIFLRFNTKYSRMRKCSDLMKSSISPKGSRISASSSNSAAGSNAPLSERNRE